MGSRATPAKVAVVVVASRIDAGRYSGGAIGPRIDGAAIAGLLLFAALAPLSVLAQTATSASYPLPDSFRRARDVRWIDDRTALLSVPKVGVWEVEIDGGVKPTRRLIQAGRGSPDGLWMTVKLAVSGDYLAVSPGVHEMAWRPLSAGSSDLERRVFEFVVDMDVFGSTVLVLGTRRDEKRRYSPDGAAAWLGDLKAGFPTLRPIFFSSSGPGAERIDACGAFGIGGVRFLPDGRFVVVPGSEPGVFLYRADGELQRTWDSEALGIETLCDFDPDQEELLGANLEARWAWLNQRRFLAEILPLDKGPALVLREVRAEGTRWILKILRADGSVETEALPVTSRSPLARLKGDVRGSRLLLVISEDYGPGETGEPARLVMIDRTGR